MRSEFRARLTRSRVLITILQLLPSVSLLFGVFLLFHGAKWAIPPYLAAVGLIVLSAVQLYRHWDNLDDWATTGQWIGWLAGAVLGGVAVHGPSVSGTVLMVAAIVSGFVVFFAVVLLRRACIRRLLASDLADVAASPLKITVPLLFDRLLVEPAEVAVTVRVRPGGSSSGGRAYHSEVRKLARGPLRAVTDARVVRSEQGMVPFPVQTGLKLRAGLHVLRMSVEDTTWILPIVPDRNLDPTWLARLIELRAARCRGDAGAAAATDRGDRIGDQTG